MKKKWSIVLACLIISVCVCNLAACSGGETETHTHTPCNICGLCTDSGCPGASSERCPGHTAPPPVETPELKEMGTYFSGVKTVTVRDTLLDENGVSKSFDELLDRQIDVLAQDLIYRLTYVYGYNEGFNNTESDGSFVLNNLDFTDFDFNGNIAKVNDDFLLAEVNDPTFDPELIHIFDIRINEITDYQKALLAMRNYNQEGEINTNLNTVHALVFKGAIEGRFVKIEKRYGADLLINDAISPWAWSMSPSTYAEFSAKYKNLLKISIASILCGEPPVAEYSPTAYDTLLSRINSLDFSNKNDAIINFIFQTIIGNALVEKDGEYATMFENEYGGLITERDIFDINNKTSLDGADSRLPYTGIYNPRLYKGYNIVIPAIVEQALSNTFENTDVGLYPSVSRDSVSVSSTFTNLSVTDFTQGIVLMPKANTPMTKLAVEVQGQAGQTATLSLKAVIGGTEYPISQSVTFTGEKQTIEIDLSSVGKAMGAYNGNTQSYTDNRLFGNTDLPDAHGDNYILLNLSGANGNCTLSFNGLYDK